VRAIKEGALDPLVCGDAKRKSEKRKQLNPLLALFFFGRVQLSSQQNGHNDALHTPRKTRDSRNTQGRGGS